MKFIKTKIEGVWVIEPECRADERGFFARIWCAREFAEMGLKTGLAQCSISYNNKKGCLRGMHYQSAPYEEAKLVCCQRGSIYDVVLDLRHSSGTYRDWVSVELTSDNYRMLYVPEGVAHGFQTTVDETVVCYYISEFFSEESSAGVRWNDPAFGIVWPDVEKRIISERDASYKDYVK